MKENKLEEEKNYSTAFTELQEIVSEIEKGEISVDVLYEKVEEAAKLIKICRNKLSSTEENVNKILKELETTDKEDKPQSDGEDDEIKNDDLPF